MPSAPGKWAKLHLWLPAAILKLGAERDEVAASAALAALDAQRVALFIDHEPMELVAQSLSDRVTPQYPREIRGSSRRI